GRQIFREALLEIGAHFVARALLEPGRSLELHPRGAFDLWDGAGNLARVGALDGIGAITATGDGGKEGKGDDQTVHVTSCPVATATTRATSTPRTTCPSSASTAARSASTSASVRRRPLVAGASTGGAGAGWAGSPLPGRPDAGPPTSIASSSAPNCASAAKLPRANSSIGSSSGSTTRDTGSSDRRARSHFRSSISDTARGE